jgi:hypothetical protein
MVTSLANAQEVITPHVLTLDAVFQEYHWLFCQGNKAGGRLVPNRAGCMYTRHPRYGKTWVWMILDPFPLPIALTVSH